IKAVVFDFIGTIVDLDGYSVEKAEEKLYNSLAADGLCESEEKFLKAYRRAYEKYREIRYDQLVEVSNVVWISEALNSLGYDTAPSDKEIQKAVNAYFEDYLGAMKLRRSANPTIRKLFQTHKVGIISNFTYAQVIYSAIRKLQINDLFQVVLVSEAVGWRKPSLRIFHEALDKLQLTPSNAIYVGDTPLEDVQGANSAGMKTAFIPSQFNSLEDMRKTQPQPDYILENLSDVIKIIDVLRTKRDGDS
ncbi:MAG: HAD family hydrolase, partial [Candidatus Bathyarchaeota archaeon]|nr:HAD family hydrolase [Candidatus Bathyarchaeota archaeon]